MAIAITCAGQPEGLSSGNDSWLNPETFDVKNQPTGRESDGSGDRKSPLEIPPDEFRRLGHQLVDQLAGFLGSLRDRKVTSAPTVSQLRALLGDVPVPTHGMDPGQLLEATTSLLIENSLFNGHPRFWGYVTSSAAPIGALGDLIAATINQNVGAWQLSPMASEIESQTIRWIAEFVGYPVDCGGLMVSGGNTANFVGFLAGRRAMIPWDVRKEGLQNHRSKVGFYCSKASHTWVQKAADLFGLGTEAIRWIPYDAEQRMDLVELRRQIESDRVAGVTPLMVVAVAGSVGTGSVDPIVELSALCRREKLWLHVDGAYGAMAAALPEAGSDLKALGLADSVALDPHKWLYSPLEAGCVLVRDPRALPATFSFHPEYYKFDIAGEQSPRNYYELGLQNSRGFRALKVWLAFRQVGSSGFVSMIREDIRLARAMFAAVSAHPELETYTCHLSITTFRFVPRELELPEPERQAYLNRLNEAVLAELQKEGEVFLSNAVLNGDFVLRACIVNFRTSLNDVQMLPGIVVRIGREQDAQLRAVTYAPAPVTSRHDEPGAIQ